MVLNYLKLNCQVFRCSVITFIFFNIGFLGYGQSINGGYSQGLINVIPDAANSENFNELVNIKPVLGFWRLKIVPIKYNHGLNARFEVSLDNPTQVNGLNQDGGRKFYEIS
ncbi:MAG: hypothetical protein WD554_00230, partial [Flavobacteriaceae bacterium]